MGSASGDRADEELDIELSGFYRRIVRCVGMRASTCECKAEVLKGCVLLGLGEQRGTAASFTYGVARSTGQYWKKNERRRLGD